MKRVQETTLQVGSFSYSLHEAFTETIKSSLRESEPRKVSKQNK
jgi:hypothetical protein